MNLFFAGTSFLPRSLSKGFDLRLGLDDSCKFQNGEDDYDQAHEIDHIVHGKFAP